MRFSQSTFPNASLPLSFEHKLSRSVYYFGAMSTYPFLSDEWLAAVRHIRERYIASGTASDVALNLFVSDAPGHDGELAVYVHSDGGVVDFSLGAPGDTGLAVSTNYATAKELFLSDDAGAATKALMQKRLSTKGNLFALAGMMQKLKSAIPEAFIAEVRSITAP